jgi:hypothetical protein
MNGMQKVANICRWIGRILGTVFVLFIVVFFFGYVVAGHGPPNPFTQPISAGFQGFFAGIFLIVVGTLIGWRWEFAGGLTALTGLVVLLVCQMYGLRGIPFFLGLPGVLFLVSAALSRLERTRNSA